MKYVFLFLLIASSYAVQAQPPKTKLTPGKKVVAQKPRPTATPTPVPLSEKEQFDKASAYELAPERVAALEKFVAAYPQSEHRPAAVDLLTTSRVLIAEEMLIAGDAAGSVELYKKIVEQMPVPVPDDLYMDTISKIPMSLYAHGQRTASIEVAKQIEGRVEGSAPQLLELANFYLRLENGSEVMRLAAKASAKDPSSGAVHRTLALAHRINFDLDLSADEYAKAVELEPDSAVSKRGLAEMKRALGKSDEAVSLYRDLLSKNGNDNPSRNGLILALFESGKTTDAEAELTKALEANPKNVVLLSGVAYWFASQGNGDRAVELAQKALTAEPRYIWAHIAYGRGLMAQGKPVEAEQVLVSARKYGNFPTLEYEIASSRAAAGFFREAIDDLSKQFAVTEEGVTAKLGGRITRNEKSFSDLIAFERRASIFAFKGADTAVDADVLKALLVFDQKLQATTPDEAALASATDALVAGTDKMRFHRELFAASELLKKRVAVDKVLELAKAVTGDTDSGLEVANAGAAVMASELYDPRQAAFAKDTFLMVPNVPRPTLSAILRGRVEEITGWALYQKGNFPESTIRLRRAVSVLPANSAWWRSSMWRLGAALEADGKGPEALNYYIDSYKTDRPDAGRYAILESLYVKVNGSTDGLAEKIGGRRTTPSGTQEPTSSDPGGSGAGGASTGTPDTSSEATKVDPSSNGTTKASPPPSLSRDVFKPTLPRPVNIIPEKISSKEPKKEPVKVAEEVRTTATEPKSEPIIEQPKQEPKPEPIVEQPKQDPQKTVETVVTEPKPQPPIEETKKEPEKVTEAPKAVTTEPKPQPPVEEPKKESEKVTEAPKAATIEPKSEPPVEHPKKEPEKVSEEPKITAGEPKIEPSVEQPKKELEKVTEEPKATVTEPKSEPPTEQPKKEPEKAVEVPKVIITEPRLEPAAEQPKKEPEKTPNEPPADGKPATEKLSNDSASPTERRTAATTHQKLTGSKPLFEPIIITIPDSRKKTGTSGDEKAADASGTARPRVIAGQEVPDIQPCTIGASQESISLINGGGSVGILVNVEAPGDVKDLSSISSSPKDVTVTLEPEISGIADRRFFVIKSVSTTTGEFRVSFVTPCGRKDVVVTVR